MSSSGRAVRGRSLLVALLCGAWASASAGGAWAQNGADVRRFEFGYTLALGPLPVGEGPIDVFVPLAQSDEHQRVLALEIDASVPGERARETRYGNAFWHGHLARSDGAPLRVAVRYRVERRRFATPGLDRARSRPLDPEERARWALFLGPNARVPVNDPVIQPILAEIRAQTRSDDPLRLARGIYDWIVDNLEYKKVGSGWGNGDTYWACSARYGNCTDFHALYTSLARTVGIPARFAIGFPVPESEPEGEIGGYHCWLELWLPELGWVPIDASEASKHKERRELFFGTQPADRFQLTFGRDLRLGDAHRGPPLNYFVYPYVELRGEPWTGRREQRFHFRELPMDGVAPGQPRQGPARLSYGGPPAGPGGDAP